MRIKNSTRNKKYIMFSETYILTNIVKTTKLESSVVWVEK